MSDCKSDSPQTKSPCRLTWGYVVLGIALYIADQASKIWAVKRFDLNWQDEVNHVYFTDPRLMGNKIEVIEGYFNFIRVHNTGVAFGFGNGTVWSGYVFLLLPILAMTILTILYIKKFFCNVWMKLAYIFLMAGIAGNLTDRLIQGFLIPYKEEHSFFTKLMNGYVVDFIDIKIPVIDYVWPTFNIADSLICCAAGILFICGFFMGKDEQKIKN